MHWYKKCMGVNDVYALSCAHLFWNFVFLHVPLDVVPLSAELLLLTAIGLNNATNLEVYVQQKHIM